MSSKQKSILIVGGGTFGTSTAYHISKRGYTNVTVLDRWAPPSKEAAGNDINKVIRADYPEPLYADLATESINEWRNPNGLFAGLYHRCGWLMAAIDASLPFIEGSNKTARERGFEEAQLVTSKEVNERWSAYDGEMPGWKTYWNSSAGWANARGALKRMADAAQKAGVQYISGSGGHVVRLLFDNTAKCIGVESANDTNYFADEIVLAAGAAAASILDMKGQLVAKGHTVGHIQLRPDEVKKYAAMPIVDHLEEASYSHPKKTALSRLAQSTSSPTMHPHIEIYRCHATAPTTLKMISPSPSRTISAAGFENWHRRLRTVNGSRHEFDGTPIWQTTTS